SGNTEFVCQKAVELGVSKIVPIESKFTIAKADTAKIDRLSKITQEACKQCGRAKTVPVDSVINIKELADKVAEYDKAILCYENEKHLLLKNSIDKSCRNIAIIIGSEGGFSIDEVKLLTDSGAVCVTLGKRVLRAETASVYALSVIDSVMND
ncbi:MAG: RsmE family RNA methyltransferase, partial [Clostridia bacterium]